LLPRAGPCLDRAKKPGLRTGQRAAWPFIVVRNESEKDGVMSKVINRAKCLTIN
jgi:hypothetical protein